MSKVHTIMKSKAKKHVKLAKILKYIFVDICKIDQTKYYILGSYAIREKRNINDLDINLEFIEFLKLEAAVNKGFGNIEFHDGQIRWNYDLTKEYNKCTNSKEKDFSIEAFQKLPNKGFPNNTFSLASLKKKKGLDTDAYKHQFMSLNTLLRWKRKMNRPKDKPDIEIIKDLLKK